MALPMLRISPGELEKNLREHDESLLKKAKSMKDLLVEISGEVTYIEGHTKLTSHTPESEMIIGGRSPRYSTGHISYLELSLDSKSPVKKLIFNGYSRVATGDHIAAGIFLGEKTEMSFGFDLDKNPKARGIVFTEEDNFDIERSYVWTQRDFNEEENALYLKIIRNGREVGKDNSADYDSKKFS